MSVDTDTLESMCELVIDCPHYTPKWTDIGYIVLRNQNIKNGTLNLNSPSFTHKEDFQRRNKRAAPKAGDIVFTREAPMGEVCMIPDGLECCLGQRQVLLRPKNEVCGKYLFWALQSPFVQHQISWNEGTGSTVSNVRIPVLKALDIPRHPKKEAKIAKVLSDLADKIELNRQINQTLENIAQAIFKSWFVDFEPTRAKIAAKQTGQDPERAAMAAISGKSLGEVDQLNPEQQEQLKTTAALFPDALVDSELGEIPEGWEIFDLKSTTAELRRGISPKYCEEDGVLVINQKCIRNHSINFSLARLNDPIKRKVDGRQIELGDVLVNSTGVGTLGRVAPVRFLPEFAVYDSHVTVVRADTTKISVSFLNSLMLEKESFIEASGAGSTGQTELRKQVLEDIQFVKPTTKISVLFDSIVAPMGKQIARLEQEQKTLVSTRDTLLPKLLSGELGGSSGN